MKIGSPAMILKQRKTPKHNGTRPTGDNETVPIDHYVPFLVFAAVAIIGYIGTKK